MNNINITQIVKQYFVNVSKYDNVNNYLGIISSVFLINYHYYLGVLLNIIKSNSLNKRLNKLTYKIFLLDSLTIILFFIFSRYLYNKILQLDSMVYFLYFSSLLYLIIICFYYLASNQLTKYHIIMDSTNKILHEHNLTTVLLMNLVYWILVVITASNYSSMNLNLQVIFFIMTLPFIILLFIHI